MSDRVEEARAFRTGEAIRYHPGLARESYDVLVIGSGLGGLSAASLLAQAGRKVLVLERHYVTGGFTHTFRRKGFVWDVGVHYVGEVHNEESVGRQVFDYITGGKLRWASLGDVYDTAIIAGDRYEFLAGADRHRQRLIDYFPGERVAIERYFEMLDSFSLRTQMYFGERAMPRFLSSWAGYFLRRGFRKYSDVTTYDMLRRITDNDRLISVLCAQCGDYGLTPRRSSFAMHVLLARHYLDGGNYPCGGASSIHEAVLSVIQEHGGQVAIVAEVDRVLVEGGKAVGVRMANGDELRAPVVISNASARNTFQRLVQEDRPWRRRILHDLQRVKPSYAHVCLYLGLDRSDAALDLPRWNYWIYDSYDFDGLIERYAGEPEAEPPFAYISFPSAKDPDWKRTRPGKSTVQVIGVAPYEWFASWRDTSWQRRGPDYEAFKQRLSDRLLRRFLEVAPQAGDHIEYSELSTPLSTRHFSNHPYGEIYGLEHTPERFRLPWLRTHTPVRNLLLTGQDVVVVGVTSAAMSGVLAASVVLRRNMLSRITR